MDIACGLSETMINRNLMGLAVGVLLTCCIACDKKPASKAPPKKRQILRLTPSPPPFPPATPACSRWR